MNRAADAARAAIPSAKVRLGFSVSHVHIIVHSTDSPWATGDSEDVPSLYLTVVETSSTCSFLRLATYTVWEEMPIHVSSSSLTGGAGFVGSHVAAHLAERGFRVVAVDNLERASAVRRLEEVGVPLVVGDVRRVDLPPADAVVHAAAYISVEESWERPYDYMWNNAAATARVAKQCAKTGTRLIYISSAAVYGDGTQTRDFIHVADVAQFVEVVLDRGAAGVFNVGTGRAVSIRELAAVVMRLAGLSGEPLYAPPRPGDIKHSAADMTKAKALGWELQIGIEEGLRELWSS